MPQVVHLAVRLGKITPIPASAGSQTHASGRCLTLEPFLKRTTKVADYEFAEMTSRKQPGVAFWATVVVVVVLVGYLLSFGPACWWLKNTETDPSGVTVNIAPRMYWPIGWLAEYGPRPLSRAINWYGTVCIYWVHVPINNAGDRWIVLVQKSG